jgi:GNAT superfamily N-acetyltransferase
MTRCQVFRFDERRRDDFRRLHSDENGAGWCRCVAWWVPTWEGWGERTAAENASLRDSLCDAGEYDGYLAFDRLEPVGWCQVGPRDRLAKLVLQLGFEPDAATWAITCFLVAPSHRGQGVARTLLRHALDDDVHAGWHASRPTARKCDPERGRPLDRPARPLPSRRLRARRR